MPWRRNDSDPLEAMRRKLAEQERHVAEQVSRVTQELHDSGKPPPVEVKPVEPPVWRTEEDGMSPRAVTPASKSRGRRPLARQRQRDRTLFFIFIGVFLIVVIIVLWIAYAHDTVPANGV